MGNANATNGASEYPIDAFSVLLPLTKQETSVKAALNTAPIAQAAQVVTSVEEDSTIEVACACRFAGTEEGSCWNVTMGTK